MLTPIRKSRESSSRAAAARFNRKKGVKNGLVFVDNRGMPAVMQRIVEGEDPVAKGKILDPAHEKDLIYGLADYRSATLKRLAIERNKRESGLFRRFLKLFSRKQETQEEKEPKRTIDEYNSSVGINDALMMPPRAAIGIYIIRNALENPASWKSNLKGSEHDYPADEEAQTNSDEQKWMTFLVRDKQNVGLWDLGNKNRPVTGRGLFGRKKRGEAEGLTRIKSKRRFEKNTRSMYSGKFTPADVNTMLGFGLDENAALAHFSNLDNGKKEGVADWIQKAFFRRTSKLGIDFATSEKGLNARVHFNLTSSEKQSDSSRLPKLWGIKDEVEKDQGHRKITESEYRYVFRLLQKNPRLIERVKFYSEFED